MLQTWNVLVFDPSALPRVMVAVLTLPIPMKDDRLQGGELPGHRDPGKGEEEDNEECGDSFPVRADPARVLW